MVDRLQSLQSRTGSARVFTMPYKTTDEWMLLTLATGVGIEPPPLLLIEDIYQYASNLFTLNNFIKSKTKTHICCNQTTVFPFCYNEKMSDASELVNAKKPEKNTKETHASTKRYQHNIQCYQPNNKCTQLYRPHNRHEIPRNCSHASKECRYQG